MISLDADLRACKQQIIDAHYTHSIPSGKSAYYRYDTAIVCFAIPANQFIGKFLLGRVGTCWELARLWAPDQHEANLLTRAVASATREFHCDFPAVDVLVSYADPNVGHRGGVYRAASWVYTGQAEESRYYTRGGQVVSRRKFHSGPRSLTKREILALGYEELRRPGRHRFARGLTRWARRDLANRWGDVIDADRSTPASPTPPPAGTSAAG